MNPASAPVIHCPRCGGLSSMWQPTHLHCPGEPSEAELKAAHARVRGDVAGSDNRRNRRAVRAELRRSAKRQGRRS